MLHRDDTLIASDMPFLATVVKFAREDARREHSQDRPACYVITGLNGFKHVGSHVKGMIRWEDQSQVDSSIEGPGINRPPTTTLAFQNHSPGTSVSPSKSFTPIALPSKGREMLDQPVAAKPGDAQEAPRFTNIAGGAKLPRN